MIHESRRPLPKYCKTPDLSRAEGGGGGAAADGGRRGAIDSQHPHPPHPSRTVQYRRTVCSLYVHTIRQIMLLLTYEMSNEFKSISSCAASSATTVGT